MSPASSKKKAIQIEQVSIVNIDPASIVALIREALEALKHGLDLLDDKRFTEALRKGALATWLTGRRYSRAIRRRFETFKLPWRQEKVFDDFECREPSFGLGPDQPTGLVDRGLVCLNLAQQKLIFGSYTVAFSPREFAFYRLLAAARLEGWTGACPDGLGSAHQGWLTYDQLLDIEGEPLRRFFEFYESSSGIAAEKVHDFRLFIHTKISAGLRDEACRPFIQTRAKLNSRISEQIETPWIQDWLCVVSAGRNPARMGLSLNPAQIEVLVLLCHKQTNSVIKEIPDSFHTREPLICKPLKVWRCVFKHTLII